jgi:hypothetical protein
MPVITMTLKGSNQTGLKAFSLYVFSGQESGSGTFLRAFLLVPMPAGVVEHAQIMRRTASDKKEPDPGPLNTYGGQAASATRASYLPGTGGAEA